MWLAWSDGHRFGIRVQPGECLEMACFGRHQLQARRLQDRSGVAVSCAHQRSEVLM